MEERAVKSPTEGRVCGVGHAGGVSHNQVILRRLSQKLIIEIVNENLSHPGLGKAVLSVHGNELTPYALQLWKRHWCCWELECLFHVLNGDVAASFAFMVLLVCYDLSDDI
jgi:hypothetical protein